MMMVLKRFRFRRRNDVGEETGRMAFHFVMVLVGLLEALIAAKREQDYYYYCLTHRSGSFVDGVLFSPTLFFLLRIFYYSYE